MKPEARIARVREIITIAENRDAQSVAVLAAELPTLTRREWEEIRSLVNVDKPRNLDPKLDELRRTVRINLACSYSDAKASEMIAMAGNDPRAIERLIGRKPRTREESGL